MREINEAFGIKPPFETDVIPKNLVSRSLITILVIREYVHLKECSAVCMATCEFICRSSCRTFTSYFLKFFKK